MGNKFGIGKVIIAMKARSRPSVLRFLKSMTEVQLAEIKQLGKLIKDIKLVYV